MIKLIMIDAYKPGRSNLSPFFLLTITLIFYNYGYVSTHLNDSTLVDHLCLVATLV